MSRELGLDRLAMRSLSALARARFLAGDLQDAVRLSAKAIELLGDRTPPEATEICFTHYRVLEARVRLDEALSHLETAHRLVTKQADAIQDGSLRDRFLSTYGEVTSAWEKHRTTPPG